MIAFGWHMHSLFRLGFGLPYHPNINPIFVSFHLNRSRADAGAIDYLRAHGPVGCRDWTTVDLLLSAGVDAFFTGCLTTTVNAVFPDREDVERRASRAWSPPSTCPPAAPDQGRPPGRGRSPTAARVPRGSAWSTGIAGGDRLLEHYQRRYGRVVTSRLHSYLPATSLGIPVELPARGAGRRPLRRPARHGAGRAGVRRRCATTSATCSPSPRAGRSPAPREDEVYGRWRERTADRSPRRGPHARPSPSRPRPGSTSAPWSPDPAPRERACGPHDAVDPARSPTSRWPRRRTSRPYLPVAARVDAANASGPSGSG